LKIAPVSHLDFSSKFVVCVIWLSTEFDFAYLQNIT